MTIEKGGPTSYGGGISNSGALTLTNSTVSGNHAAYGGGIANFGTLTLTNSTVSGNHVTLYGGGIYNYSGTVTLTNSTVSGNSADFGGGDGIFNYGGTVTLTNSTVSGNFPSVSAGTYGGGIYNQSGTVTLTNSTVSGNSADYGGGINNFGMLTLTNSTISGNGGSFSLGIWRGIANFGTLTLKSTIVAANYPNCFSSVGATSISDGYNLSDDAYCSDFLTSTSDNNNIPAGLDPFGLQDNGGPTKTIALLPTSPAVDAIPVANCTDVHGNPITTDQRGITRPQGPACDIGAYEFIPFTAEVQPPINSDGSSVFNSKRGVVPVKFTLTENGSPTCNLPPATISLARTAGGVPGPIDESSFLQAADSGSNFRFDGCQYVYNLASNSLGTGTYLVQISIDGFPVGSATFGLQ